jgi:hypothetical protein
MIRSMDGSTSRRGDGGYSHNDEGVESSHREERLDRWDRRHEWEETFPIRRDRHTGFFL